MSRPAARAVGAAAWLLAGQALGFAWALTLVHQVGVGDYGRFATGLAAAALLTVPLDAAFLVRAPRVSEEEFRGDRVTRTGLGVALVLVGAALLPWAAVPGLALGKGGSTILLSALRSRAIRDGHPQRMVRSDTLRALLCFACGAAVLVLVDDPPLAVLVGAWLLGYLPWVLMALPLLTGARPRLPERTRRTAAIVLDALGAIGYLQGDVLLVSLLLSATETGRYGFAALVVAAIGAIGMNYGATFHERLRAAGGHPSAGPAPAHVAAGAVVLGLGTVLLALAVGVLAPDAGLRGTLLAFAPVAVTRFTSGVLTTLLVVGGHDVARLRITLAALVTKAAGIAALGAAAGLGARGAALGYLAGDAVMLAGAVLVLRRGPARAEVAR